MGMQPKQLQTRAHLAKAWARELSSLYTCVNYKKKRKKGEKKCL